MHQMKASDASGGPNLCSKTPYTTVEHRELLLSEMGTCSQQRVRKRQNKIYHVTWTHLRNGKEQESGTGQQVGDQIDARTDRQNKHMQNEKIERAKIANQDAENTGPLLLTSGIERNRRAAPASNWEAKSTRVLIGRTHARIRRSHARE